MVGENLKLSLFYTELVVVVVVENSRGEAWLFPFILINTCWNWAGSELLCIPEGEVLSSVPGRQAEHQSHYRNVLLFAMEAAPVHAACQRLIFVLLYRAQQNKPGTSQLLFRGVGVCGLNSVPWNENIPSDLKQTKTLAIGCLCVEMHMLRC